LGYYDFVSVIEAPDDETMAHLAIDVGARGSASYTVLPALSIQELLLQLTDQLHLVPKVRRLNSAVDRNED
jgi:uncharacterized protein with GYD domain